MYTDEFSCIPEDLSLRDFTNIMVVLKKCANHSCLIKPPEEDEIADCTDDADTRSFSYSTYGYLRSKCPIKRAKK